MNSQKLIPDSWKQKINTGYSQAEESKVKIKHRTLRGKKVDSSRSEYPML